MPEGGRGAGRVRRAVKKSLGDLKNPLDRLRVPD